MPYLAEEIERAALEDFHAAASAELRARLGIESRTPGSAFLSIASALPAPAIVINRVIGLGFSAPETEETIQGIVDAYRSAGVARYFVQIHPDARPQRMGDWLLGCGLERTRGWQKFSRGREPVPSPKTELTIREIGTGHGADSAAILSDAFDLGDGAGANRRCFVTGFNSRSTRAAGGYLPAPAKRCPAIRSIPMPIS